MAYTGQQLNDMEAAAKKRLADGTMTQQQYSQAIVRINMERNKLGATQTINTGTPAKITDPLVNDTNKSNNVGNKDLISGTQTQDNIITNNLVDKGKLPESQRENIPQVTQTNNNTVGYDISFGSKDMVGIPGINMPVAPDEKLGGTPSDEFNKLIKNIEGLKNFSGGSQKSVDAMVKSKGSVDAFRDSFYNDLNKKLSSGVLTKSEVDKLKSEFNGFLSSVGHGSSTAVDVGDISGPTGGLGNIRYATGTDSEGNTIYSSINLDNIAQKVGSTVFNNETFQTNFNKYITSLESQIKTQRDILEGKNKELQNLYTNQSSQFQERFGTIFKQIQNQETEMKTRFGDIEKTTVDYFNELDKNLLSKEAAEKSGLSSDIKSRGLSDAFIANSLSTLDTKYGTERLKNKDSYLKSMNDLTSNYDRMYQTLINNTSNLTQSELDFSKMVLERQKELIDGVSKFESDSVAALYQPLNEVLKSKMEETVGSETKIEGKKAQNEMYRTSESSDRIKIIYDYMGMLTQNGIDVSKIKETDLIEASKREDLSLALAYLTQRMGGDDTAITNITNAISSESTTPSGDSRIFQDSNIPRAYGDSPTGDTKIDSKTDTTTDTATDTATDTETGNVTENIDNQNVPSYLKNIEPFLNSLLPKEREFFEMKSESLLNGLASGKGSQGGKAYDDFYKYIHNTGIGGMDGNGLRVLVNLENMANSGYDKLAQDIASETRLTLSQARTLLDNKIKKATRDGMWESRGFSENFLKGAKIATMQGIAKMGNQLIDQISDDLNSGINIDRILRG